MEISPRELEYVRLMVAGLSCKEIADKMGIAPRTVKYYSDAVRLKLGLKGKSLAAVVAWAFRNGIVK